MLSLLGLLALSAALPRPLLDCETIAPPTMTGEGLRPGSSVALDTEAPHGGQRAIRVRYDFVADPPGLQYVGFHTDLTLPDAAGRFSVWVHGDGRGQTIALRLRDVSGETHQWRLGQARHTGWKEMAAEIAIGAEHWGGDGDGILQRPIAFDSLLVDSSVEPATGEILFDDLATSVAEARVPPEALPLQGDRMTPCDALYATVEAPPDAVLSATVHRADQTTATVEFGPVSWTGPFRCAFDTSRLDGPGPWRLGNIGVKDGQATVSEVRYLPRRAAPRRMLARLADCDGPPPALGGQGVQPACRLVLDTTERAQGSASWQLDYAMADIAGMQYVEVPLGLPLGEAPARLRVRVSGDGSGNSLRCRLTDASGEYLQYDLGPLEFTGWFDFDLDLTRPPAGHWGGDENGACDGAASLVSILVDSSVKPSRGTIRIDDVRAEKSVRPADQLQLRLSFDRPGGIYVAEAPAEASLTAMWTGDVPPAAVTVRVILQGEQAAEIAPDGQPRPLPLRRLPDTPGYYEAQLAWEIEGDVASLRAPFCVLPAMPATDLDTNLFGACLHYAQHKGRVPLNYALLAAAGGRWARDEYAWGAVERERGVYTFPEYNEGYMRAAGDHGLRHLIILDYGNPLYDEGNSPASDEAQAAFAAYCGQMVRRYRDVCRHWEIYNEPNIGFWKPQPDPRAYARLLRVSYEAIKEADPDAVVVGICTAGVDLKYIEAVLEAGGGAYMDALSVHPYRYPNSPEATGFVGELTRCHELMERYGIGEKKLWLTEVGWPNQTDGRGVSEETTAAYLVRMVSLARSLPFVGPIVWYDLQNDGTNPTYNEDNFGLLRLDFSPKRPFLAAAMMNRVLAEKSFERVVEAPPGVWIHEYEGQGLRTLVIWTEGDEIELELPLGAEPVEVSHVDGRIGTPRLADGRLRLIAGGAPAFVSGSFGPVRVPGATVGQ